MNKTFIPYQVYNKKKWYIIDAKNETLGRLSSKISNTLQGKNKINFYPSIDNGNYVIVINAKKIKVTGNKEKEKLYRRHSGRPGSMKLESLKVLKNRIPKRIIEKAVKGMLPKTSLGRKMFNRLKIFNNNIHFHLSQSLL